MFKFKLLICFFLFGLSFGLSPNVSFANLYFCPDLEGSFTLNRPSGFFRYDITQVVSFMRISYRINRTDSEEKLDRLEIRGTLPGNPKYSCILGLDPSSPFYGLKTLVASFNRGYQMWFAINLQGNLLVKKLTTRKFRDSYRLHDSYEDVYLRSVESETLTESVNPYQLYFSPNGLVYPIYFIGGEPPLAQ